MVDNSRNVMAESGGEQAHYEDEVLETIWEMREITGDVGYEDVLTRVGQRARFERMERGDLFEVHDGKILLTEKGESRARDIIRRHRLAERLFRDVLDMNEFEEDACHFEHAISPEVEEAICTLLGHPPHCPHGKEIPRGRCCKLYTSKVKPLVRSLKETAVGKRVKVLFLNMPSIDRLTAMGLVPGSTLKLQQRNPSYVIQVDETTIAIDEDIAKGIYVKEV
jgi:DtxR family Mn-dependent transcriptional regulator